MARRSIILGSIAASQRRKATNAMTQQIYRSMWGEEAPKKYKKVKRDE